MIKKNYKTTGLLFLLLVIILLPEVPGKGNMKMLAVESVPIHNSGGWGYDIVVDRKIFIHQPYIPAVMSKKEFSSKKVTTGLFLPLM